MTVSERISGALSENLLTLLAHSDEFGKIVASIADPNLFEGEYRHMADTFIRYWRQNKEAPKTHAADLFADILEDKHNRKANTYRRIFGMMAQLYDDGINAKWVLDQLRTFTRLQLLKAEVLKAAEQLNDPKETTISDVEEMLGKILRARHFDFDPGIRLTDYPGLLAHLENHLSEFDTGIRQFDEAHIVPARGTVFLIMGASGKGKTWSTIQLGKRAALRRQKVLHLTLEVDYRDIQLRYYQSFFSASKREAQYEVTRLDIDDGKLIGMNRENLDPEFSLDSSTIVTELETLVPLLGSKLNNIMVKQFPMGALTMNGLRGYLDMLGDTEGFYPDMLILDSPKLMKLDKRDIRVSLGQTFEEFRGLCTERNIAGVATHQLSKEGAKAKVARSTHVAEDWSMVHTSDIIITFSCTDAEERFGLGRLYADKVRSEKGKIALLITQSYDIGQFVLESHRLTNDYFDHLKDMTGEDPEEEE